MSFGGDVNTHRSSFLQCQVVFVLLGMFSWTERFDIVSASRSSADQSMMRLAVSFDRVVVEVVEQTLRLPHNT